MFEWFVWVNIERDVMLIVIEYNMCVFMKILYCILVFDYGVVIVLDVL